MVTSEIFENLKNLQEILVEKYDLEKKVEDAPKQLSTQEEFLARLKAEFIKKNSEYEEVKERVGRLKLELDDAVKSRESGELGMDNISTHREYEALEKQINEATERENDVRKTLQTEEKLLSELDEGLKTQEEMIKSQEDELNNSKESVNNQLKEFEDKLNNLKTEEDKITPNLDQEILFKFERIIQRNSEGIVAVRNGVCTGCHMILPAQFANTVRVGDDILFCPYCSRILYHEDVADDQVESYFDIGSAGSLAGFDEDFEDEDEDLLDDEEKEDNLYDDENPSDEDDENLDDEDSDLDDEDLDEEDSDLE